MGNNTEDYSDDDILGDDILDTDDDSDMDIEYEDISDEDISSDGDISGDGISDDDILNDDYDEDADDDYDGSSKRGNKKGADIVRYCIIAVAAVVFLVSVYMLADIFLEYKQGVDIYQDIAGSVLVPVEKNTGNNNNNNNSGDTGEELAFVYDHESLLAINPEGQGYLYVPSIDLRLPVVQGTDNEYYLNHTFNKIYNGAGALFIDSRIENGIMGSNVIIYGHNMKNGSMFAKLLNYRNESFYRQPGNDLFYIYVGDKVRIYKIFAAFENDPQGYVYTCNFGSAQQLQEYAKAVKEYSLYDTNVDVSKVEQVVTFSTCTSDGDRRVIVQGAYIGERSNSQINN